MKKWIWLLILNFFIAAPAFAAGTLTAKLNRNPVPVGETFVLSLEYEGDPGSEKPDFSPLNRDFTVYMVSNSYKGIYTNGKMKKLYIWNVTMAADRTGAFTIPPLSVGKAESRPITLKVVAADGLPPAKDGKPAAPKFSVSRSISNSDPLVQQQINYTFKITAKEALQGNAPQFLSENADEWIIRALGDPVISTRLKDGVEEREITFKYALFPQKSGNLVIPEVRFDGYYADPDAGRNSMQRLLGAFSGLNDDAFGLDMFGRRVPIVLKARPIDIKVGKIPAANNGNWWLPAKKAEIYSDWQQKMPAFKSGEAVSREVYLRVTGVIDTQLPEIRFPEVGGMKQYPEKPITRSEVKGDDVVSVMKIKTVYIPEKNGRVTIPEIAVNWYNVNTRKMEKAVLPAVVVNIAPGAAAVPAAAVPAAETKAPAVPAGGETVSVPVQTASAPLLWYLLAAFAGGIAVSMTVVWFVLGRHSRKTETEKKSEKPVSVAKAVRGNDLRAVRDNVLAWARKAFPDAEVRNLDDVAALADDRAFAGELQKLQKALYSGRGEDYNPAAFMEAFAAADKRRAKRKKGDERLLPGLYE